MNRNNPNTNRPGDLLDEFLTTYGYARKRVLTRAASVYFRTCDWDDDADEWRANWHLGGLSMKDPSEAIAETFTEISKTLRADSASGKGRLSTIFDGLAIVLPGEGRYCVRHRDGREWEELTEDERRDFLTDNPTIEAGASMEESSPTRLISLISLEGLAAELTVFVEDREPIVERVEQWVADGNGTVPDTGGPMEEALLMMFTFVQLMRETIGTHGKLTLDNLTRTATNIDEERGGAVMSAQLLQLIGSALEAGVLTQDDNEGGDCLDF